MSYLDSAYDELLKEANSDGLEGVHEMIIRNVETGLSNFGDEYREISFGYKDKPSMRPIPKRFNAVKSEEEIKELKKTNMKAFKSQTWNATLGRQMYEACGKTPFKIEKSHEHPKGSEAIEIGDTIWVRIERGKPKEGYERGFLEIKKFIPAPKAAEGKKAAADDEPPF